MQEITKEEGLSAKLGQGFTDPLALRPGQCHRDGQGYCL